MGTREAILARRAHFVAAALGALSGCPRTESPKPGAPHPSVSASTSASTSTSTSASASAAPSVTVPTPPEPPDAGPIAVKVCLSLIIIEKVRFAPGSAKLVPEAVPIVDASAEVMKAHPELRLELEGHCDAIEKPCPDEARARTVKDALVARGVDAGRIDVRGAGRDHPAEPGTTDEARKKNRRVEMHAKKD